MSPDDVTVSLSECTKNNTYGRRGATAAVQNNIADISVVAVLLKMFAIFLPFFLVFSGFVCLFIVMSFSFSFTSKKSLSFSVHSSLFLSLKSKRN